MFSILKKFNCLVLPGVLLKFANFFLFVRAFIIELLPTFDLPMKAISLNSDFGKLSLFVADVK